MAIVKMKKVAALGAYADRKELLSELMKLGVVEITEQKELLSDEAAAELLTRDGAEASEQFEKKLADANAALAVLEKYAGLKQPIFTTRRRVGEEWSVAVEEAEAKTNEQISELLSLENELRAAAERKNKAESDIMLLSPWREFDIPLELSQTRTSNIVTGMLPKSEALSFEKLLFKLTAEAVTENGSKVSFDACVFRQVSEDKDYIYAAMISRKEETQALLAMLKPFAFSVISLSGFCGTAAECIEQREQEMQQAEQEMAALGKAIKTYSDAKAAIEEYVDRFIIELDKEKIREKLLRTAKTFMFEGWLPAEKQEAVSTLLEDSGAYYTFREPSEDEEAPVLLRNSSFFAPTEAITEMYSLPSYGGFDPTSIYSLFYIIFFGMMFSDAGYGLLLTIGCAAILKKFDIEGTMKKMFSLFFWCGISTTAWGVLFGGFFGDLIGVFSEAFLGKQIAFDAVWFNPLDDPMTLLIFSLILGVIHLFIGMGIQAYMQLKEGKILAAIFDEGAWYVTILGLAAWLCGSAAFDSEAMQTLGMCMSIIGAAAVLIGGGRGKKGFAKITGGLANLYNITSWISDILSYARLLALGLATGVIAQVVNTMGSLFGGGAAGIVLFILIFIVGHAVNFAINLLGAFIHSARLQYVEFFGKFYIDGGEAFDPFRRKTKYVRIENEE